MPWKHNGKTIMEGKPWVADDGTQHPATWSRWSDDDKKSKGLTWEDQPASDKPFDNRFYSGRKTDGSLIERSLTDINAVDENGKAIIDPITGKQMVELGLKSIWVAQTKQTAQDKLNKHDWMIIRNAEKSTAIPSDVTTYRDAIRTKCASIETAINNCSSHADFMKLFDTPSDGSNPTINDFPDEI
tara:strand:- start:62 stop:619 length:558 start_codon:yes stop_codon:yes gene_type:complete